MSKKPKTPRQVLDSNAVVSGWLLVTAADWDNVHSRIYYRFSHETDDTLWQVSHLRVGHSPNRASAAAKIRRWLTKRNLRKYPEWGREAGQAGLNPSPEIDIFS